MISDLIRLVDNFMNKTGWSLYRIALKANISYSTLRRIYLKETSNPVYTTVYAIIDVVATSLEKAEFIHSYFPVQAKFHKPIFEKNRVNEPQPLGPDAAHYLGKWPYGIILLIASTPIGLQEENIADIGGRPAMRAVEEMTNAGIISRYDDGYFRCPPIKLSLRETIGLIQTHCETCFNPDSLGLISRALFGSLSLSTTGKDRLAAIISQFFSMVIELRDNPEFVGSEAIFIGLISSPYFSDGDK